MSAETNRCCSYRTSRAGPARRATEPHNVAAGLTSEKIKLPEGEYLAIRLAGYSIYTHRPEGKPAPAVPGQKRGIQGTVCVQAGHAADGVGFRKSHYSTQQHPAVGIFRHIVKHRSIEHRPGGLGGNAVSNVSSGSKCTRLFTPTPLNALNSPTIRIELSGSSAMS